MRNLMSWYSLISLLTLIFMIGCESDPCEETICENGGVCIEGSCDCPEGFEGEFCETSDANSFLGNYTAEYGACVNVSDQHRVAIQAVAGDASQLTVDNLGDYACPDATLRIIATMTGNQVSIDSQVVDCGPIQYTFQGSGTFQGADLLELSFTVSYEVDGKTRTDACQATLEK